MKKAAVPCGADQGGRVNDPVTHYVLFQPEIGTEETSHTSELPGDDAVYVVADSPEPSGTMTTEEWLSASGSLSECSAAEQTARKTKKKHSFVWEHFDRHTLDKCSQVCKHCNMSVRLGKEGGCSKLGTTAMRRHLEIHHAHLLPDLPPRVDAVRARKSRAADSVSDDVGTNGEEPAFLEFMRCCAPQWKVPNKGYFANSGIPALATMIKEAVRKDLKTCIGGTVHLGTETWQGPHMSDLVSVTAFWVKSEQPEQNLVRCKAVLDVVNLGESCTLENVSQALETVIKDWLLPAELKVGHLVTERLPSEALPSSEVQLKHITCMAHCLDFEVENLLFTFHNKLADSFDMARTICSQLCRNDVARAKLKAIQSHHNLKQRPLVPDSPTNWKSTLRMLKHFCEQKLAVNEYLKGSGGISVSPEQWLVLRDAASVLQPVEEVVRLLSMDTAVLGQVLPLLCFAEKMLQSTLERSERGSPAHWLSAHLLSKLSSSSHVTAVKADLTYWTASFLDPRFRDTFCSYISSDEAVAEQKLNEVKKHLLVKIRETYMHSTKLLYAANTGKLPQQDDAAPSLDEDFSLWLMNAEQMGLTRSKAEVSSNGTNTEGAATAAFELEAYVQDSIADFSAPMSDPALYWQTKRMIWPSLYTVAVTYLACPPTNTYSERMFEKYGAVALDGRQGICADTLSILCFIRMNHVWVPKDISAAPADVINSLRKAMDKGNTEQDSIQFIDTESEVLLKRVLFQD
ncbi:hypothetical protein HPB49_007548 [Dermacentor silvarum]|uniref:Uncharacterized protein n=1 Tax=Dermacentor silvarum TaxID=543639 RepID=A0ACB8C7Z3_DERSI|nr:hypothetical protein HPB49_007548 [Dermacentor silvarum]